MEKYILSLLIFIPVFGAIMMLPISKIYGASKSKYVALGATGIQLILSVWLYCNFDSSISVVNPLNPFTVNIPWIEHFNIFYYIGVDGLSMPMVLLTALLVNSDKSFIKFLSSNNLETTSL